MTGRREALARCFAAFMAMLALSAYAGCAKREPVAKFHEHVAVQPHVARTNPIARKRPRAGRPLPTDAALRAVRRSARVTRVPRSGRSGHAPPAQGAARAAAQFARQFAAYLDGAGHSPQPAARPLAQQLAKTPLRGSARGRRTLVRTVEVFDADQSDATAQASLTTGSMSRRLALVLRRGARGWAVTRLTLP